MGDFGESFQHKLETMSLSMYSQGMFLILVRMYARIHRLGIRKLQLDDYLMLVAACLYTLLIASLNAIARGGGSNLFAPGQFDTFTPDEIEERIKGSKIVIVSEQAMLNVIYVVKFCMLILYTRLTLGHKVQRMVKYLAIYVVIGWVATEIAFFTACRPFTGYWAMPPPNSQCSTLQHYAIVQASFNISSDILMLFIPLPLVTRLAIPFKKKIVLLIIFSMGLFDILAAILTKVFNLSNIFDPSYMLWYTREASVAIYVSNLPMIWPLMREWFPFLRSLTPAVRPTGTDAQVYGMSRSTARPGRRTQTSSFYAKQYSEMKSGITTTIKAKGDKDSSEQFHASVDELDANQGTRPWDEEHTEPGTAGPLESANNHWRHGSIQAITTVEISEEHITNDGHPAIIRPASTYQQDAERMWYRAGEDFESGQA